MPTNRSHGRTAKSSRAARAQERLLVDLESGPSDPSSRTSPAPSPSPEGADYDPPAEPASSPDASSVAWGMTEAVADTAAAYDDPPGWGPGAESVMAPRRGSKKKKGKVKTVREPVIEVTPDMIDYDSPVPDVIGYDSLRPDYISPELIINPLALDADPTSDIIGYNSTVPAVVEYKSPVPDVIDYSFPVPDLIEHDTSALRASPPAPDVIDYGPPAPSASSPVPDVIDHARNTTSYDSPVTPTPPASGLARTLKKAPVSSKPRSPPPASTPAPNPTHTPSSGPSLSLGPSRKRESPPAPAFASAGGRDVVWSRWDCDHLSLRLLFVLHADGLLKVWDCTDLGQVEEVFVGFGPDAEQAGRVVYAGVVPRSQDDVVIGILTDAGRFSLYSLSTHTTLSFRLLTFDNQPDTAPIVFQASRDFIVVSTTSSRGPALHVLSTATLDTLAIVPPSALRSYVPDSDTGTGFAMSMSMGGMGMGTTAAAVMGTTAAAVMGTTAAAAAVGSAVGSLASAFSGAYRDQDRGRGRGGGLRGYPVSDDYEDGVGDGGRYGSGDRYGYGSRSGSRGYGRGRGDGEEEEEDARMYPDHDYNTAANANSSNAYMGSVSLHPLLIDAQQQGGAGAKAGSGAGVRARTRTMAGGGPVRGRWPDRGGGHARVRSVPNTNTIPNDQRSHQQQQHQPPPPRPRPRAVFALSRRLLAYAAPAPAWDDGMDSGMDVEGKGKGGNSGGGQVPLSSSAPAGFGSRAGAGAGSSASTSASTSTGAAALLGLPTTQAELGSAALRVGGSVWGGMRMLSGLAMSAARSRVGGDGTGVGGGGGLGTGMAMATGSTFFSRSAPAEGTHRTGSGSGREKTTTPSSGSGPGSPQSGAAGAGEEGGDGRVRRLGPSGSGAGVEGGCSVIVVDLAALARGRGSAGAGAGKGAETDTESGGREPAKVAQFLVSRDSSVAGLRFSSDGCSVLVAPRDGQVLQVYRLRPGPSAGTVDGDGSGGGDSGSSGGGRMKGRSKGRRLSGTGSVNDDDALPPPWHVYDLRRGRTSAVVEGAEWAHDGRWVAIGTRKRTVHVFAANPYGGKPDQASHLEGRVKNVEDLPPMPVEVNPLVRLRVSKHPGQEQPRVPLAFTFINPADTTLPNSLLPAILAPPPVIVGSSDSSAASPPISPRSLRRRRPTNFQDVLLFDPTDESLTLRRCVVEVRQKEQGIAASSAAAAARGATSISLPGTGGAAWLSASPSTRAAGYGGHAHVQRSSSRSRSGLTQMMDASMELVGKENVVATWNLERRRDTREVKRPLESAGGRVSGGGSGRGRADWLSEAELSTFSRSQRVLPRPIYLSHQFSFHTLGEDYHALIRRYQFDIGGDKIEVRREVQVSAYPAGSGESFVEGFSAPRDIRGRTISSSFDEPLASALAGGLEYPHISPILPMLPNGTPSSKPQAFRSSIPIRTMAAGIGDGMSESFGRIRREIGRVRSPRLKPRPDSGMSVSVPLEFDEEDEDFLSPSRDEPMDVPNLSGSVRDVESGPDGGDVGSGAPAPIDIRPVEENEEFVGGHAEESAKGDDVWNGWSSEDKLAIEEAEKFDNISVVGFLDEEQEQQKRVVVPVTVTPAQKRRVRGRRR